VGLLAAGMLAVAGPAFADASLSLAPAGRVPTPVIKVHKGDKCVEPTEVMRRDHMNMILHQRDETMHRGIRSSKHSLKECINCHADPVTNSVLGPEGFCEACHTYAAVSMDCFSCHTPTAESKAAALGDGDRLLNMIQNGRRAPEVRP
jgi:hypothetical protein